MPADPARAQEVFLAAVELPDPAARPAYVAGACGGDADLRARVEALLRAYDQPDSLLDAPIASAGDTRTAAHDPDQAVEHEPEHDADDALTFLAPATRPGSLGRIGQYEVLEVLGRGGFGTVYRAFDEVLQRVVAVKVLAPSLAATSPARKRFLREARSAAQVRHENVVQVHAVEEQPLPYLVMEYVPGGTLQQRLDRTGPLDIPEVLRIGRQLAEGLAAAHGQGLIHRDIKPSNVLVSGDAKARVTITDFGLARAADDASLTRSGVVAGTPMYMAPEQARGETLDHRADLFSLGSVLYQMASGRPPFRASTTMAVLKRVCEETPRPIREVIPEVPVWFCRIVEKLHAKDPAERYQSAREVADVLADCETQLQAHGALKDFARIPGGRPTPHPMRRKLIAFTAVLWAVTGLFWAAILYGPYVIRYAGDRGEIAIAPEEGWTSVIVHKDGDAITDWYGVNKSPVIELPPGQYKLEPAFAPGRELDHWEITTEGLFSSRLTLTRAARSPTIELGRGERVTIRAVMRDDRPVSPDAPKPADGFVSLFNGRDLTGWTERLDGGAWRVPEPGVLAGTGGGFLFTDRDYSDFHLRADVRVSDGGHGGLWFRCDRAKLDPRFPVGFHAIVNPTDQRSPRTGSLTDPFSNHAYGTDPAVPADTWFTYEVIAVGDRVTLMVNGKTTLDGRHGDPKRPVGPVGLQLPGPGRSIAFRKVEVKDSKPGK